MNFTITKTRINAPFSAVMAIFKNHETFQNKTQGYNINEFKIGSLTAPIKNNYNESALVSYEIAIDNEPYILQVVWTQSAQRRKMCHDVFFILKPSESTKDSLIHSTRLVEEFAESLRYEFNEDWKISDADLSLDLLK